MFVTAAHAQSSPATGANPATDAKASPTAGTHTQTGAPHEAKQPNFPPFDTALFPSQLLWLAISFVLFYLFVQKAVIPRIDGILENRHNRITQDLDEAQRLKGEADEAVAAYHQELARARGKAEEIAQQAHDKAKREADAERAEVEKELDARTEAAEKNIAEIKARALGEIDTVASDTAGAIVERLIGASVTEAELSSAIAAVGGKQGART